MCIVFFNPLATMQLLGHVTWGFSSNSLQLFIFPGTGCRKICFSCITFPDGCLYRQQFIGTYSLYEGRDTNAPKTRSICKPFPDLRLRRWGGRRKKLYSAGFCCNDPATSRQSISVWSVYWFGFLFRCLPEHRVHLLIPQIIYSCAKPCYPKSQPISHWLKIVFRCISLFEEIEFLRCLKIRAGDRFEGDRIKRKTNQSRDRRVKNSPGEWKAAAEEEKVASPSLIRRPPKLGIYVMLGYVDAV